MKNPQWVVYFLATMIGISMVTLPLYSQEAASKEPSAAQEQRLPKILQIAQLGNPVLREPARPVENLSSPFMKELMEDLKATVFDANGLGLAAPQVYQSHRVFILACRPTPRYPNAPTLPPTIVINPDIISASQEKVKDWEGCLSIPGIRALVPRHKTITVKYTTEDGRSVQCEYTDILARIFQHEFDHLNGLVFLDRLDSVRDIVTEKEYQRIVQNAGKK
jgi:peptide deformylase